MFHSISWQVSSFFVFLDNRKRSSYNGYFSFRECFSDYECDYGRECDSDGFCIPVEGKRSLAF